MSSMNYVVHQLQELGLSAEIHGETVYCEDIDLDFDRSHDGVRGISRWLVETREEYAEVIAELHKGPEEPTLWTEEEQQAQADLELAEIAQEEERLANEESPDEEPWTYEEAVGREIGEIEPEEEPESYSEDVPCHTQAGDHGEEVKPHFFGSPLDDPAMSPKEIARAAGVDDQDRGGVANPEDYIRDMKVVHSEKAEFEVSGIGYVTGEFKRRFTERDVAQNFAHACVAAAKSPKYASTIRVMTV